MTRPGQSAVRVQFLTSRPTAVHSGATVPAGSGFLVPSRCECVGPVNQSPASPAIAGSTTVDGVRYDYLTDGSDIYRESFRIIREETDLARFPDDVARVVVRMVHAAGAPDVADDVAFTPGVVAAANVALRAGAPILCDSSMVATGIIRSRLPRDNDVVCHIKDPSLAALAAEKSMTKTMAAIDLWLPRLDGAVVAIGNAPTALFRLLEVVAETGVKPAAVIGIPVGFVGAAESKQALADNDLGLEYLVVHGRRGGSALTVAAVNAIASTDELTNTSRQA